jgi:aspartyl-tRNA(Asn)/glutamyl-tRNA(Gln) amidotransferase subunit B
VASAGPGGVAMSDFEAVIGLEVHAQLSTESKIFCGCSTKFGAPPNHHTCPVCLGMPGVLPVLNVRVVEFAIRSGLALQCEIRKRSIWARKNYFYPDLPKGYQISQYELPICENGRLIFDTTQGEKTVRIHRIHMEEDAGKNIHDPHFPVSQVDFNRAGVPLVEIVSEPDMSSAEEASEYLRSLRDILVYLGVSDGNMEEGSLRCDANVSLRPVGSKELGTKTEMKNMNSFRFVRQAIESEVARQTDVLRAGKRVVQETRGWDSAKGDSYVMRSKEEAHDYRYFPEPDLLPLILTDADIEAQRRSLPELPRPRIKRFVKQFGLAEYDAAGKDGPARTLIRNHRLADFFEACAGKYGDARKLANWLTGELLRAVNERRADLSQLKITPDHVAGMLTMIDKGEISTSAAKDVFTEMISTGAAPGEIVAQKGLTQVSDTGALEAVVDEIIRKSPDEAGRYKAGKLQLMSYFVGQAMKATKGKGNPALLTDLFKKKLGG